jgi:putative salt-induced outer membrane protein
MKTTRLLPVVLLAILPLIAQADDCPCAASSTPTTGWSGSGELGFAASSGNSKTQNLDAKLAFAKEDDKWKDTFYLTALRNKGDIKTTQVVGGAAVTTNAYETTANRVETGASAGYKLDDRSYIVGAVRYEHDDFSPYQWDWTVSIGYGYTILKDQSNDLSVEIGPGYKTYRPIDVYGPDLFNGVPVRHSFGSSDEIVARGLAAYKHNFNATTSFVESLLVEAGNDNTYLQNDAGLQVDMNKKLALKISYQIRNNSNVMPGSGIKNTDQLVTTNLVYKFGG